VIILSGKPEVEGVTTTTPRRLASKAIIVDAEKSHTSKLVVSWLIGEYKRNKLSQM